MDLLYIRIPTEIKAKKSALISCLKDMPLFTRESSAGGALDYLGVCLSDIKFISSDSGGSGFDEAEVSGETYVKDFALNADTVGGNGCILYPKG